MLQAVCENHPRRTRGLFAFTYVDADGIAFVSHYCAECVELEIEESFEDWQPVRGGYRFEQPREAAPC